MLYLMGKTGHKKNSLSLKKNAKIRSYSEKSWRVERTKTLSTNVRRWKIISIIYWQFYLYYFYIHTFVYLFQFNFILFHSPHLYTDRRSFDVLHVCMASKHVSRDNYDRIISLILIGLLVLSALWHI